MKILKMFGGLRGHNKSRCDTCVSARIVLGYVAGQKITFCNRAAEPVRMPFPVSECSDYSDRRVTVAEPARTVGFAAALGAKDPEEQVA